MNEIRSIHMRWTHVGWPSASSCAATCALGLLLGCEPSAKLNDGAMTGAESAHQSNGFVELAPELNGAAGQNAFMDVGLPPIALPAGNGGGEDEVATAPESEASDPEAPAVHVDYDPHYEEPPFEELSQDAYPSIEELRPYIEQLGPNRFQVGDMLFPSEDAVLEAFAAHPGKERDKAIYWSDRLWTPAGSVSLSVCFMSTSDSTAGARTRVRDMVRQTWEATADVTFTGWGNCANPPTSNITIHHHSSIGRGLSAVGTDALAHADPTMELPTNSGDPVWEDTTAVHEFGHALGFHHEFLRTEYLTNAYNQPAHPWNCSGADANIFGGETSAGGTVVVVGSYDPDSVMNYCWDANTTLTTTDVNAIWQMYGRSDWPYIVHLGPWRGTTAVSVTVTNQTLSTTNTFNMSFGQLKTGTSDSYRMSDSWTAAATPPNSTWKCNGSSGTVPAGGLSTTAPMKVHCYRAAEIMAPFTLL